MRYSRAPRPSPARAGQGGLHAQRGLLGDKMRQVCGPLDVRPCGHHLLHQPDPQCLGRAGLLGGEQEAHRVARAQLRGHAEGGPAEWHDAAADLQLAEPHIIGGDHDAGGRASSIGKVNAMPLTPWSGVDSEGVQHAAVDP